MDELIFLALGVLLFGPLLGIWALARSFRLRADLVALRAEVAALRLGAREAWQAAPEAEPAPEPEPATDAPVEDAGVDGETDRAVPPEAAAPAAPAPPPAVGPASIEDRLASQWLVWIGAAAMALGAGFLVKYTIDQGWFGPAVRVTLGGLLGLALMAAGEGLRRRPLQRAIAALRPDHVPAALTSAGLFAAFASAYAAYALYDFLAPGIALVLLAGVAFAAIALSVIQGPLVALLGVAAGFVTPMLVQTDAPSAWTLFPYLLAIAGAARFITHYRGWLWLGWTTLAGAALWPLLWFAARWHASDAVPAGLYLLAIAALFVLVRPASAPPTRPEAEDDGAARAGADLDWDVLLNVANAAVAALVFALLRMDGYGAASIAVLFAYAGLTLFAGRRDATQDRLPGIAAMLALAAIAAWHLPWIVDPDAARSLGPGMHGILDSRVVLAPGFWRFTGIAAALAALFGGGGFALMWGAARPARWALLAAATPVALLGAVYWRLTAFQVDIAWGLVGATLAALYVGAAASVAPRRAAAGPGTGSSLDAPLGLYAAAAFAALGLAAAMVLRDGWLTVALAAELPALAWIEHRLGVPLLRHVALALAATVLVRLGLNWNVLDYPMGSTPGFNWLLYGYGVPAAAFAAASRMFRRTADDALVSVLEGGAIAFAVLLISLEIRTLVTGSIGGAGYTLLEQALHSASWLAIGAFLAWRNRAARRPVAAWASRLLAGTAAAQIVLGALLFSNPLWTDEWVGAWPIVNVLLLAYAVPAGFAVVYARELDAEGLRPWAAAAGIAAIGLGFVFVGLQVTQMFHGAVLTAGPVTDAEQYAYSAAWLAYAGALLALGMATGRAVLRYASLVLVLVTIGKVFLFDMAALAGLWRVASFLGLGLALVGIGFVYQRWVLAPGGGGAAGGAAAPRTGA